MQQEFIRISRNFYKLLVLKFTKQPTNQSTLIFFKDFFRCEKSSNLLGYAFLKCNEAEIGKIQKLSSFLFQLSILLFLILEIISLILSMRNENSSVMLENAMYSGIIFVVFFKIIVVYYCNVTKIHEIIKKLDEYFPHSGVDQLSYNTRNYLRTAKWIEKLYYGMFGYTAIHMILTPYMHLIYGIVKSVNVEWELIINLKLPIDLMQPIVYEAVSIVDAWMVINGGIIITSTDLIFINLAHILTMEFEILNEKFKEMDLIDDEIEVIRELKNLVKIHQDLIEMSEKLDEVFSPLQLVNAFGSIVAICTGCFLAVVRFNIF